jgi:hypothetical protein
MPSFSCLVELGNSTIKITLPLINNKEDDSMLMSTNSSVGGILKG